VITKETISRGQRPTLVTHGVPDEDDGLGVADTA
jgi:hypothetical protein